MSAIKSSRDKRNGESKRRHLFSSSSRPTYVGRRPGLGLEAPEGSENLIKTIHYPARSKILALIQTKLVNGGVGEDWKRHEITWVDVITSSFRN